MCIRVISATTFPLRDSSFHPILRFREVFKLDFVSALMRVMLIMVHCNSFVNAYCVSHCVAL